ncbi:MAG: DUF342 domain-containing protein, partial [Treponema sp.]|nr:DUF342 domain-containing protein [Treponema sp.]
KIYQDPSTVKKVQKLASEGLFTDDELDSSEQSVDRDGMFYVRRFGSDIMLKIVLPLGDGSPIQVRDVLDEVKREDTVDFDENAIKNYIKNGTDNDYQKVGDYRHVMGADVLIAVDISKDEMSGTLTVSPPAMSGQEASFDAIRKCCLQQGILADCILEDKIREFVDTPVYNTPFEICHAVLPQDGHDAYVSYNFETDPKKLKPKISEDSGNINFKQLNQIQNVIAGQPLATKVPAEKGKGGKTLLGRWLDAKDGKDIVVQLGANTEFDRDGITIKATIDGEVMLVNNKVTVEPVKYLDAVNIKTGDIKFVGTVIIKGDVEEGYRVEATNIEVNGIVEKSHLEATGNIVVSQGIFGKGEGYIKAGKSLWAKFINETTVEVEENVVVNENIMNSYVTAMKNIVVRGKKSQIVGGHLLATEEICAKKIGSSGGVETILEVGIDPRAKKRLEELQKMQSKNTTEYEKLDLDVQNLEQQKKLRKKLPQEKEDKLNEFKEKISQIYQELEQINDEIAGIQAHLKELKAIGKVKVEDTCYAGVKIYIRDALDEVKMDCKKTTFFYDDASKLSKRGDYEPPAADIGMPDGYTAD